MTGTLEELGAHIGRMRPECVVAWNLAHGELNVEVALPSLAAFAKFLKTDDECRFTTLIDITAVDRPERDARFDVIYHFLSMSRNRRVRVRTAAREGEPVASITGTFPAAGWFEREAFDMFGIPFAGHPDLRRLLSDYGFQGHPLRKDFPTTGYTEVRYDESLKKVVYEPVNLVQEYRNFDFMSPWEGAGRILSSDDGGGGDASEAKG